MRLRSALVTAPLAAVLLGAGCTDPGTGGGGGPGDPPIVGVVTRLASDGVISSAVISRNGRYVAFVTTASTPGADANAGANDVFVIDRTAATTTRVSNGNGASDSPSVADDGSVVFRSASTDLAGPDTNGRIDAFRWTPSGGVSRITDSPGDVISPLVSADGSTVVFSAPERLTTPAAPMRLQAFRWQPSTPAVTQMLTPVGTNGASAVAIGSDATFTLLAEPGRLALNDSASGVSTLVYSAPPSPAPPRITTMSVSPHAVADDGDVVFAEVTYTHDSATGVLTFESGATMRWDRQTGGVSVVPSVGATAGPVQSSDGRHVVTADMSGVSIDQDAPSTFLRGAIRSLDTTTSQSVTVAAAAQATFGTVSGDGRYVAFVSTDTNVVVPDPNGADADLYLWDRGS